MSVPDEGYSRNVSCTLNLISTFLLQRVTIKNMVNQWSYKLHQYGGNCYDFQIKSDKILLRILV